MEKMCVLAALAIAVAACDQTIELPSGAAVECASDAECPSGLVCIVEAMRCFPPGGEAATLVEDSFSLDRLTAGRNASVEIRFDTDGELIQEPQVLVQWGGAVPGEVTAVAVSSDGGQYRFRYDVGENEPEGFVSVEILLVSRDGIPSNRVFSRVLELDFSPPQLLADATSISVVPPAGSLIEQPTALTAGGAVQLLVALSEPLGAPPEVFFESDPSVTFECDEPLGVVYSCRFLWTESQSLADGIQAIAARIEDEASNSATLAVVEVTIDTISPMPPEVTEAEGLLYIREPYGESSRGAIPSFRVLGAAGVVEGGSTVVVWDRADIASGAQLGRATAATDGSLSAFEVFSADRPRVFVTVVDAAGNPSDDDPTLPGVQASLIPWVRYRATMGTATAQSSHPHSFQTRSWFSSALEQPDSVRLLDGHRLAGDDDDAETVTGAGDWILRGTPEIPDNRVLGSAFDQKRNRVVSVVEGVTSIVVFEFDGWKWRQISAADFEGDGEPAPRFSATVAYSPRLGQVVLLGGRFETARFADDMWAWTGRSWRLLEHALSDGPGLRTGAKALYDEDTDRLFLFGGEDDTFSLVSDTYSYGADGWQLEATGFPSPRSRSFGLVRDPGGGILLQGGSTRVAGGGSCPNGPFVTAGGSTCLMRDTWRWRGGEWQQICDSDPSSDDCLTPFPTTSFAIGYNRSSNLVHLFAGSGGECLFEPSGENYCDEVFTWDGSDWSQATISDALGDGNAAERNNSELVYAGNGQLLSVGGDNDPDGCDGDPFNTLACDSTTWFLESTAAGVEWRRHHRNVENPGSVAGRNRAARSPREFVLLPQSDNTRTGPINLWRYALGAWEQVNPGAVDERWVSALTYHAALDQVVLFGGLSDQTNYLNDFYALEDNQLIVLPNANAPSGRSSAQIGYDRSNDEVLMFGGSTRRVSGSCENESVSVGIATCRSVQTWRYTAGGSCGAARCWEKLNATADPISVSGLAYDESRNVWVRFGGSDTGFDPVNETREWTGTEWALVSPPAPLPPARTSPAMIYDTRRERITIFGGNATSEGTSFNDVWEYDGTQWQERQVADAVADGRVPNGDIAVGHDTTSGTTWTATDRPIEDLTERSAQIWNWLSGADERPAQVFSASFDAVGESLESVEVARIRVSWIGSADSQGPALAATPNFELFGWSRAGWSPLRSGSDVIEWCTTIDALSDVDCVTGVQLERWLEGANPRFHLAAAPLGTNGSENAVLNTDYVDVELTYSLE